MEKKKGDSTAQKNLPVETKVQSDKSLRELTAHTGLHKVSESIIKFKQFTMINEKLRGLVEEDEDVIAFLYSLKDNEITGYVNEFLTTNREEDKEYYLQDILLEIGTMVDDNKFDWVSKELKKFLKHDKRKHQ